MTGSAQPGLFVTGTDTGVGKTTVSLGLLRLLRARGRVPIPFKPAETGCNPTPEDAQALWRAAQPPVPPADVCLYAFRMPAAPAQAAAAEQATVDVSRIVTHARALSSRGDFLLVEGAGGLLVPYAGTVTAAELAKQLGLPLLIVARTALGTINHTVLTLREAARHGLEIAGVILNRTSADAGPHEAGNAAAIASLTGHLPMGPLSWLPPAAATDPARVAGVIEAALGSADLDRLLGPAQAAAQVPAGRPFG